jgi:hypothetical protein
MDRETHSTSGALPPFDGFMLGADREPGKIDLGRGTMQGKILATYASSTLVVENQLAYFI